MLLLRICSFLLFALFTSCAANRAFEMKLASINIIDRDGMSETINNKERLQKYAGVDFMAPQPYQKVLRVYKIEKSADIPAFVTSYHPNGQLRQYLEVMNGRAFGSYREWYLNGIQKLEADVIGGVADVTVDAEKSWLFDGMSFVWDEEGALQAEIPYEKGELSGLSIYYHPNGNIAKKVPYERNSLQGLYEVYRSDGSLLLTAEYCGGRMHGEANGYWENGQFSAQETFFEGKLITGIYFDRCGNCVARITNGNGWRAVFTKEGKELREYRQGILDGEVKIFDHQDHLTRTYSVKNGIKNGEEIIYYPFPNKLLPKLSIYWVDANMNGLVKTWYESGMQESQREMSRNVKNGLLTAWYKDGNLMLIEEYDNGKLIKGKYFRKNDKNPISKVIGSRGTATLYDGDGNFLRKVAYNNGVPAE